MLSDPSKLELIFAIFAIKTNAQLQYEMIAILEDLGRHLLCFRYQFGYTIAKGAKHLSAQIPSRFIGDLAEWNK